MYKVPKRMEGNPEVHGEETGVWEEQQAKTDCIQCAWSRNAPARINGKHSIQLLAIASS